MAAAKKKPPAKKRAGGSADERLLARHTHHTVMANKHRAKADLIDAQLRAKGKRIAHVYPGEKDTPQPGPAPKKKIGQHARKLLVMAATTDTSSQQQAQSKPTLAKPPEWAPQRKKGESHAAYVGRFYTAQREHAEETGDQKTVDKIYGKLGRKSLVGARKGDNSLNVDANTTDKAALAAIPAIAAGGRVGLRALGGPGAAAGAGRAAASAASKIGQKVLGPGVRAATKVAKPASVRKLPGGVNRLPSTPQKALPSGRTSLPTKAAPTRSVATKSTKALPGAKSTPDKARTYNATGAGRGRATQIKTTKRGLSAAKKSSRDEVASPRRHGSPTRSGIKKTTIKKAKR